MPSIRGFLRRSRRGFSLLELLVALVVGALILDVTLSAFAGALRTKRSLITRGNVLSTGVEVEAVLRRDLEHAGLRLFSTYNVSGANAMPAGAEGAADDTLTTLAARGGAIDVSSKDCTSLGPANCSVLIGDVTQELKPGDLVLIGNPQTGGRIVQVTQIGAAVARACAGDCSGEKLALTKTPGAAVTDSVVVGSTVTYKDGRITETADPCPAIASNPDWASCVEKKALRTVGNELTLSGTRQGGQNWLYTEITYADRTATFGYPSAPTWTPRSGAYGAPAVKAQTIRFARYYIDRRTPAHPMLVRVASMTPTGSFGVPEPVAFGLKTFMAEVQHQGDLTLTRGVGLTAANFALDAGNPNVVLADSATGANTKAYSFKKSYLTISSIRVRFEVQEKRKEGTGEGKVEPFAVRVATNALLAGGSIDRRGPDEGYRDPLATSTFNVPPYARLMVSPNPATIGQDVTFSDNGSSDSDGTLKSYSYDFGDGKPKQSGGSLLLVTHRYDAPGTYHASLTVVDNGDLSGTERVDVVVQTENVAPVASFEVPDNPVDGVYLTFHSTSTDNDGDGIVKWEWTFTGPNSYVENTLGENPTVVFPEEGTYTAKLKVTDARGATAEHSETFPVGSGNNPPNVVIVPPSCQTTFCPGGVATPWSSAGTTDPDGDPIKTYTWTWGDGSPASSGASVQHSFPSGGPYTVTLEATDSKGAKGSATVTVTVDALPVAVIGLPACASTPEGCYQGVSYQFSGAASSDDQSIASYQFWFGDGETAPGPVVSHAWTRAGMDTVRLRVTDNRGQTGDAFAIVKVSADYRPTLACPPNLDVNVGQTSTLACTLKNNAPSSSTFAFTISTADTSVARIAQIASIPVAAGATVPVNFPVTGGSHAGSTGLHIKASDGTQASTADVTVTTSATFAVEFQPSTEEATGTTFRLYSSPAVGAASFQLGISATLTGFSRGITVFEVDRNTKIITYQHTYDTFASSAAADQLATYLGGVTSGRLVFLVTSGAWEANVTQSLKNAMYALGLGAMRPLSPGQPYAYAYAAVIDAGSPANNREVTGATDASLDGALVGLNTMYSTLLAVGETGRQPVQVINRSNVTGAITLSVDCPANLSGCGIFDRSGVRVSATRSLGPGQGDYVYLSYTGAVAASGTLQLHGTIGNAGATYSRLVTVGQTTLPPPPTVTTPGDFAAPSGTSGTRTVIIGNPYKEGRLFTLTGLSSAPGALVVSPGAQVYVGAFGSVPVNVPYSVPTNARAGDQSTYGIEVADGAITASATSTFTVQTLDAAAIVIAPDTIQVSPGESGTLAFYVKNPSNADKTYTLSYRPTGTFVGSGGAGTVFVQAFDSTLVNVNYSISPTAAADSLGRLWLTATANGMPGSGYAVARTKLVLQNPVVTPPPDFVGQPGQTDTATFQLYNASNTVRNFQVTISRSGVITAASAYTVWGVGPFQTARIPVQWTMDQAAIADSTGRITMSVADSTFSASGYVTATAALVVLAPTVTAGGNFAADVGTAGTKAFTVTNRTNARRSITLIAGKTGPLSSAYTPSPITFEPFETKSIDVNWAISPGATAGQTGILSLTANDAGKSNVAQVTVTVGAKYGLILKDTAGIAFVPDQWVTIPLTIRSLANNDRTIAFTDPSEMAANQKFDSGNINGWSTYQGTGTLTYPGAIAPDSSSVLQVQGYRWLTGNDNIAYDGASIYRVETWLRETVDGTVGRQRFYVGLVGVAGDGATFVNYQGANTLSNQHYFAGCNDSINVATGWRHYVGYVQGWAATGSITPPTSLTAPGKMQTAVRFVRPVVVVNYNSGDGTTQIAQVRVTKLPGARYPLIIRPPAPFVLPAGATQRISVRALLSSPAMADSAVLGQLIGYDQALPQYADTAAIQGTVAAVLGNPTVSAPANFNANPGASGSAPFGVTSTSNQMRTYTYTGGLGGIVTQATANPSSGPLGAFASTSVNVSWKVDSLAVAGTTGTLQLTAADGGYSGSASATVTANLVERNPTVTPPGPAAGTPGATYQANYVVRNTTNQTRTLNFQALSSDVSVVLDPTDPTPVSFAPFESKTISVSYTVATQAVSAASSNIRLVATDASNGALTGYGDFTFTVSEVLANPQVTPPDNTLFTNPMLSQSGLSGWNVGTVQDFSFTNSAWHTDASVPGAWLQVDYGTPKAITQATAWPVQGVQAARATWSVQYSDNASAWSSAVATWTPSAWDGSPVTWGTVGAHRFWRLLLTNTPGGATWMSELAFESTAAPHLSARGATKSIAYSVTNRSNATRTITISATANTGNVSAPAINGYANPANVSFAAYETKTFTVTYTVSNLSAAGGSADITVTATDVAAPAYTNQGAFKHVTTPAIDNPTYTQVPTPQTDGPGDVKTVQYVVQNSGNETRTFCFNATATPDSSRVYNLTVPSCTAVAAGGMQTVNVGYTVRPAAPEGSTQITLKTWDQGFTSFQVSASFTETVQYTYGILVADTSIATPLMKDSVVAVPVRVKNLGNNTRTFAFRDPNNLAGTGTWDAGNLSGVTLIDGSSPTVTFPGRIAPDSSSVAHIKNYGWMVPNTNVPYDGTSLYRLDVWYRQTIASPGTVYMGLEGVAADGTTLINVTGVNSSGSQHYVALCNATVSPASGWVHYIAYVKGWSATGSGCGPYNNAAVPGVMANGVAYIRPLVIANYRNQTGEGEIGEFRITKLGAGGEELFFYPPAPITLGAGATQTINVLGTWPGEASPGSTIRGRLIGYDQGLPQYADTAAIAATAAGYDAAPTVVAQGNFGVTPGTSYTRSFTVRNNSNQSRTLHLALAWPAFVSNYKFWANGLSTEDLVFAPYETQSISTSMTVATNAVAGQAGNPSLTATNTTTGQATTGPFRIQVLVVLANPTVTPPANPTDNPGSAYGRTFRVTNNSDTTRTFTLTTGVSGIVTSANPASPSVDIPAFGYADVTVNYSISATAAAGATGTVQLTATDAGNGAYSGSGTMTTTAAEALSNPTVTPLVTPTDSPGVTRTRKFRISNPGNSSQNYNLAITGTTGTLSGGSVSTPVTVGAFSYTDVDVTYTVSSGAVSGTTGTITLKATNASNGAYFGSGTMTSTTAAVRGNPILGSVADPYYMAPGTSSTVTQQIQNGSNFAETICFAATSGNTSYVPTPTPPACVPLAAFAQTSVSWNISLAAGAPTGSALSTVKDTAYVSGAATYRTSMAFNVWATYAPANPTVTCPDAGTMNVNASAGVTCQVTNRSNQQETFDLSAGRTGAIASASSQYPAVTLNPGSSADVILTLNAGGSPGAGTGTLTAAIRGNASYTATGTSNANVIVPYGVFAKDTTGGPFTYLSYVNVPVRVKNLAGQTRTIAFRDLDNLASGETFESGVTGWLQHGAPSGVGDVGHIAPDGSATAQTNGFSWLEGSENIPYDGTSLYEISVWVRQTVDASVGNAGVWVGFAGVAADGTTYANVDGANAYGSQHYVAAWGQQAHVADGWALYVGFVQGWGSPNGTAGVTTAGSPGAMNNLVRYIRPLVITNYPAGGTGQAQISTIQVKKVASSFLLILGAPAPVTLGAGAETTVQVPALQASWTQAGSGVSGRLLAYDQGMPSVADTATITGVTATIRANPSISGSGTINLNPNGSITAGHVVTNNSNQTEHICYSITSSAPSVVPTPVAPACTDIAAFGTANITYTLAAASNAQAGSTSTVTVTGSIPSTGYTASASYDVSVNTVDNTPTVSWDGNKNANPGASSSSVCTVTNTSNTARTLRVNLAASSPPFSSFAFASGGNPQDVAFNAYETKNFTVNWAVLSNAIGGTTDNPVCQAQNLTTSASQAASFLLTVNTVLANPTVDFVSGPWTVNPSSTNGMVWRVTNNSNVTRSFTLAQWGMTGAIVASTGNITEGNPVSIGAFASMDLHTSITTKAGVAAGTTESFFFQALDAGNNAYEASLGGTLTMALAHAVPGVSCGAGGSVTTNASSSVTCAITNYSNGAETFNLSAFAGGTVASASPGQGSIAIAQSGSGNVTLNFTASASPGAGTANLTATSSLDGTATATGTSNVTVIAGHQNPSLTAIADVGVPNQGTTVSTTVTNNSQIAEQICFTASSATTSVIPNPTAPTCVDLGAGGSTTVSMTVTRASGEEAASSNVTLTAYVNGAASYQAARTFKACVEFCGLSDPNDLSGLIRNWDANYYINMTPCSWQDLKSGVIAYDGCNPGHPTQLAGFSGSGLYSFRFNRPTYPSGFGPGVEAWQSNNFTVLTVSRQNSNPTYSGILGGLASDGKPGIYLFYSNGSGYFGYNQSVGWASGLGAPSASGDLLALRQTNGSLDAFNLYTKVGTKVWGGGGVNPTVTEGFLMGDFGSGATWYGMDGWIGQVLVYNRALSDSEIQRAQRYLFERWIKPGLNAAGHQPPSLDAIRDTTITATPYYPRFVIHNNSSVTETICVSVTFPKTGTTSNAPFYAGNASGCFSIGAGAAYNTSTSLYLSVSPANFVGDTTTATVTAYLQNATALRYTASNKICAGFCPINSPSDIPGLANWIDASREAESIGSTHSGALTDWAGSSGYFYQVGSAIPMVSSFGGYKSFRFSGAQSYGGPDATMFGHTYTVMGVEKGFVGDLFGPNSSYNMVRMNFQNTGNQFYVQNYPSYGAAYSNVAAGGFGSVFGFVQNTSNGTIIISADGQNLATQNYAAPFINNNGGSLQMGRGSYGSWSYASGDIGEMVWYNRALTAGEYKSLAAYLGKKWLTPTPPSAGGYTAPMSGLLYWYDVPFMGVGAGGSLSTLTNRVTGSAYAIQGGTWPVVAGAGGLAAASLNNSGSYVQTGWTPSSSDYSIFVVDKPTNASSGALLSADWYDGTGGTWYNDFEFMRGNTSTWTNFAGTQYPTYYDWSPYNGWEIMGYLGGTGGADIRSLGTSAWSSGGVWRLTASNNTFLGYSFSNSGFIGQMSEVLVYNRRLTGAAVDSVENYLAAKYGLPLRPTRPPDPPPPYPTFPPSNGNIVAWLDASTSNGSPGGWLDQLTTRQPFSNLSVWHPYLYLTNGPNGKYAFDWQTSSSNGYDPYSALSAIWRPSGSYFTMAFVEKPAGGGAMLVAANNGGCSGLGYCKDWSFERTTTYMKEPCGMTSNAAGSGFEILVSNGLQLRKNRVTLASRGTSCTISESDNEFIGLDPSVGWGGYDGQIAEIIIYNKTLTGASLDSLEGYLSQRYNIPVTYGTLPAAVVNATPDSVLDQVPVVTCPAVGGIAGLPVQCGTANQTDPVRIEWGDGRTSQIAGGTTATHTYDQAGHYVAVAYSVSADSLTSRHAEIEFEVGEDRAPDAPTIDVSCEGGACMPGDVAAVTVSASDPDERPFGDAVRAVLLDLGDGRAAWVLPGDTAHFELPRGTQVLRATAFDRLGLPSAEGSTAVAVEPAAPPAVECIPPDSAVAEGDSVGIHVRFSGELGVKTVRVSVGNGAGVATTADAGGALSGEFVVRLPAPAPGVWPLTCALESGDALSSANAELSTVPRSQIIRDTVAPARPHPGISGHPAPRKRAA